MDPSISPFVLIVSMALASAASWLICHYRLSQKSADALSARALEASRLEERLAQRENDLVERKERIDALRCELAVTRREFFEQGEEAASLKSKLAEVQNQAAEKLVVLEGAKESLVETFKALASDALKGNTQSCVDLLKPHLQQLSSEANAELDKRRQSMDEVIRPIKEVLGRFETQAKGIETARVEAYSSLVQQIKSLESETSGLADALKKPQVRGRWGELQLRRVAELAGMSENCDFSEQAHTQTEDGGVRPDLLVRLSGGRCIIVDAKAPLTAYIDASNATDETQRLVHLRRHAEHVRKHVDLLGRKSYQNSIEHSMEFVVLFIPGEVFFSAALQQDPQLIEDAARQNVIIATPTTLIALLRTVAFGWREEKIAENAKEIRDWGMELYRRLSAFGEHIAKVGAGLNKAVGSYNSAVGSFESRLMVTAKRFVELDPSAGQVELPAAAPVEVVVREPARLVR